MNELRAEYKELLSEEPKKRIDAILKIKNDESDKTYEELIKSSGTDSRGEVRLAAILSLANMKDKEKTLEYLKKWANKFNDHLDGTINPKIAPILTIALINGYDIEKALDFSFDGKYALEVRIEKSGYKNVKDKMERMGYLLTYFNALDKNIGKPQMLDEIVKKIPETKTLIGNIKTWIIEDLSKKE